VIHTTSWADSETALVEARKEWKAAIEEARKKREVAESGAKEPEQQKTPESKVPEIAKKLEKAVAKLPEKMEAAAKVSFDVSGVFNALAVRGLGLGSSVQERTAKSTEQTARNTKKIAQKMDELPAGTPLAFE